MGTYRMKTVLGTGIGMWSGGYILAGKWAGFQAGIHVYIVANSVHFPSQSLKSIHM